MITLEGKNTLITGGSRGIGRAISLKLAQAGSNIVINYKASKNEAYQLAEEINRQYGVKAVPIQADVSDIEQVKKMKEIVNKEIGSINIVVNNAGVTNDKLLRNMTPEIWDNIIKSNLYSVYNVCHVFIEDMLENRWGRIINISSIVGLMGSAGQANYAAAKAGIIGFTKSIAKEYAKRKITANVICPGYIETDMTKNLAPKIKEAIINSIPIGRAGEPEEVANLVLFIASELSSYITGEVINISGGLYM
ncbi:MAG: 3-oxoacyl-[acyl-carrier-protein] reductase [Candidatus Calescibacterium sp.]|nr:3-oxoacyl-[acyl-carrier-protein] reductase [Candidatus Calescibacterium sp.]MDW8132164.1 3-oxoacyl-[acyl-carrier-protein] reductase [Candidatus Calescibacterium sp.]